VVSPSRRALSLIEIVIVTLVVAILAVPLFDLLIQQRQQIDWAGRQTLVHAYAIQRLAAEEARLAFECFSGPPGVTTRTMEVQIGAGIVPVEESISVEPVSGVPGLHRVALELTWREAANPKKPRRFALARFVADREAAARLPLPPLDPEVARAPLQ
jgi:type II secretory pathway pseudopilin PulG